MAVAHPAVTAAPAEARTVRTTPSTLATAGLVSVSLAVGVLLLYALWEFWPTAAILKATSAQPVHVFGVHRLVTPEVRLLVVVALAGALGGLMHSTRSLAWYVGHQALRWRWVPYYLTTIVVGAGLASIFYLVIRGGVLGGKATTADTNPYGFAALGALVGLFTEQALEMLRRAANEIFADASRGNDSTPPETTDPSTGDGGGPNGSATGDGGSSTAGMSAVPTPVGEAATAATSTGDTPPNDTAANSAPTSGASAQSMAASASATADAAAGTADAPTGDTVGTTTATTATGLTPAAGTTEEGAATGIATAGGSSNGGTTPGPADDTTTAGMASADATPAETSPADATADATSTTTVSTSDGAPPQTLLGDTAGAATGTLVAETGTASKITATSATLEGGAITEGTPTSYRFDYGTTAAYGESTGPQIADGTQMQLTADIRGLAPGTQYHFRLVISNPEGESAAGSDAAFTTAAG